MKDAQAFTPNLIGSSSSVLNGYTGDPFEGKDGHFVGSDGFVVPLDFIEFYTRYPNYVRNWVTKKTRRSGTDPDVEDWTSSLLLHLSVLPKGRQTVDPETQEVKIVGGRIHLLGFKDVINAFNPWAHYGATAQRFFNFINRCLSNKFISLNSRGNTDAMSHVSLNLNDTEKDADSEGPKNHEYLLMDKSTIYANEVLAEMPKTFNQILISQFTQFVEDRNPALLPLAEAIMHKDKIDDILEHLGIDYKVFLRNRKKLIELRKSFMRTRKTYTTPIPTPNPTTPIITVQETEMDWKTECEFWHNNAIEAGKRLDALQDTVDKLIAKFDTDVDTLRNKIMTLEARETIEQTRLHEREHVLDTIDRVSGGLIAIDVLRKSLEPVVPVTEPVIELTVEPTRPTKRKWYNNGIDQIVVSETEAPEGYVPGRLKKQVEPTVEIETEEIEAGPVDIEVQEAPVVTVEIQSHEAKRWYNNGTEERRYAFPPEGYVPGRILRENKTAAMGLRWFNNGVEERRCLDAIAGFNPGRLKRSKDMTV